MSCVNFEKVRKYIIHPQNDWEKKANKDTIISMCSLPAHSILGQRAMNQLLATHPEEDC